MERITLVFSQNVLYFLYTRLNILCALLGVFKYFSGLLEEIVCVCVCVCVYVCSVQALTQDLWSKAQPCLGPTEIHSRCQFLETRNFTSEKGVFLTISISGIFNLPCSNSAILDWLFKLDLYIEFCFVLFFSEYQHQMKKLSGLANS